ncbi:MAG: NUDIX domain-containing protein [Firmicutes bacterium]|nr:NUDIX domain-containing protein [Bacillota bacterium]
MDINIKIEDKVLNYRVAGIIKKDDKILVNERVDVDYVSLIGGRAKIGESSIEALIRELKEESGYDFKYVKTLGIIENFFVSRYDNKEYHEILIIHEMEFNDKELYNLEKIQNYEEENVKFVWRTYEELANVNFVPKIILNYLKKDELFHLINKDN